MDRILARERNLHLMATPLSELAQLVVGQLLGDGTIEITEVAELRLPIKDLGYLHGPTQPYELELGHAPERTETRVYMDILVGHEVR